ncbi:MULTISPECIES: pyrroloquinoline quinone biosynthesis protein PqqE [unclassified Ruegeria]|uniref:pyrroloquinoline quinone biosynthesis protein PqqE n=1 Tax=unclassified Ruegeria TaxID=2625375 RepID=UPI001269352E|nr:MULTISPECIES: pyrroloquinoline quinone biosynthesis protein PqqE [unclassified Ruegeria]QFT75621.1 Cyclic pyranopterin monophosphate synthase [Ruegeria sp. THAF33]UAB90991.1 pyrroloquinoline quinone biosynthesis protein PqqE [Ruegeria sp. SCSIO 43209]
MTAAPPIALLAELTHRCPLSCPYCSNPVELERKETELDTKAWVDVFQQAFDMGVLQLHLSGGEPASRRDLEELTAQASRIGLYTNLITSGIGLTPKRLDRLEEAGLDHVQLSLQGTNAALADRIGGYRGGFDRKMIIAKEVGARGIPLTLNAVMHRQNLDDLERTIEMAVELGARRLEVACVQFHGWALPNRPALLPTFEQTQAVKKTVAEASRRLRGVLAFDFVPPDYYSDFPKACMGGWGSSGLNITPNGTVLPCHAAQTIGHLKFANVQDEPLSDIWYNSAAFNQYRGTDWMPEPCQSCDRKEIDFGGCRCQAMALAHDANTTDPVCQKSPLHGRVQEVLNATTEEAEVEFVYRKL